MPRARWTPSLLPSQAALDLATRDSLSRPMQALASKSLAVVLERKLKEEQQRIGGSAFTY